MRVLFRKRGVETEASYIIENSRVQLKVVALGADKEEAAANLADEVHDLLSRLEDIDFERF